MKQLTIKDIGNRDVARANSKPAEQLISIPLNNITIRKSFNVRQEYGDLQGLADSIKENGQCMPGRVDVLKNGTFLLVDGHRRYEAMKLIPDKPPFKAFINVRETTEEDRLIQMFTTQDNKQLTPNEAAELIQRLLTFGKNQSQIAQRLGRSPSYISQMISFARKPEEVKEKVSRGETTIAKIMKRKPTELTPIVIKNRRLRLESATKDILAIQNQTFDSVYETLYSYFSLA